MSREYDLSRAFERIENYLIDSMMRNFKHHRAEELKEGYNWEQWQAKQLEALEEYRRNNRERFSAEFAELNNRVGEMLTATAADAGYRQEQKILKAIQKGYNPRRSTAQSHAAFFRLNERKMNALIEATTNDLSRAEFAVLRRSNDAYRKAIFDAQVFMNSGAATYEQAVDMATKDMIGAGLQCVEYKNGARHTLPDYAEMAIRTANKRAYLRGEGAKMQEWGISTVIINRRHGACGRCADFVGMVFIDDVYAGGKPSDHGGKYPLLSDAMKAGLFHPRCKDSSSLYIEGISTPPDREVLPKKAQEELTEIERAEQRAAYGRRMEKMNRRLSKYALDPNNKKMYRGRAEQWSEYTEKWQSYHNVLVYKAIEKRILAKPTPSSTAKKTKILNGLDVTKEYLEKAVPGEGTITRDEEYDESIHKNEIAFADWLHDNFGGNIHLLSESTEKGKKTPDYLWNGKLWDLKNVTSEKAANSAIRKGIRQIAENPGGIILDYGDKSISLNELITVINKRMNWYEEKQIDIMIIQNGKVVSILRYKK